MLVALVALTSCGNASPSAQPRISALQPPASSKAVTPSALAALPGAGVPPATAAPAPPVPSSDAGLHLVVVDNGVSAAVVPARGLMVEVLGSLSSEERARLAATIVRLDIIPVDRQLTDLADFAFLRGRTTFDGRSYSSLRAVGPTASHATVTYAVGAEQVLPAGVSPYGPGFAVAHESGHVVRHLALTTAEDAWLRDLYTQRHRSSSSWLTDYASRSDDEYFADSTAAWFLHPWSPATSSRFSRAWLRANDPQMAALLQRVYGQS